MLVWQHEHPGPVIGIWSPALPLPRAAGNQAGESREAMHSISGAGRAAAPCPKACRQGPDGWASLLAAILNAISIPSSFCMEQTHVSMLECRAIQEISKGWGEISPKWCVAPGSAVGSRGASLWGGDLGQSDLERGREVSDYLAPIVLPDISAEDLFCTCFPYCIISS